MRQKSFARIALRRIGIVSLERPAAGGESCKQDSFLYVIGNSDGSRLYPLCLYLKVNYGKVNLRNERQNGQKRKEMFGLWV